MINVRDELFKLQDINYKEFTSKLTPSEKSENFIGVRVPLIRKLAKEMFNSNDYQSFLDDLPHKYNEENLLHSFILGEIKEFDKAIKEFEKFLPYMNNWQVTDSVTPKSFAKNKEKLIAYVKKWAKSDKPFIIRFAISTLMSFYLDDDFDQSYFEIVLKIKSENYYVKMMNAWYFATALAKKWEYAIKVLENKQLDKWTHNKVIQKAKESFRMTKDQKQYLKTLSF